MRRMILFTAVLVSLLAGREERNALCYAGPADPWERLVAYSWGGVVCLDGKWGGWRSIDLGLGEREKQYVNTGPYDPFGRFWR